MSSETNGNGHRAAVANHAAMDLGAVLRAAGPYFGGEPPDDAALFERIELCGRLVWALPSNAQRIAVQEHWVDYLKSKTLLGVTQPFRVVQAAFAEGRLASGSAPADEWLTHAQLQDLPTPVDLVRGHLPAGGLAILYGPRGIGKTFFGLDVALSVQAGANWHGYPVLQGPVAYVLAEGRGGLERRIGAWLQQRQQATTDVRFLCRAVRLLDAADVDRLVTQLVGWEPRPALVVIDTMARCLVPGDENSTQDMSAAVAALDRVREATGALVMGLHHTGHDKTRERGSTALGAAADTVLSLGKDADVLTLSCEKQRDSVEFQPVRFRLHPAGQSVVPQRVYGAGPDMTETEREVLQVLEEACQVEESVPPNKWHSLTSSSRRQFYRAVPRLIDLALIERVGSGKQVRYRPVVTDNERE